MPSNPNSFTAVGAIDLYVDTDVVLDRMRARGHDLDGLDEISTQEEVTALREEIGIAVKNGNGLAGIEDFRPNVIGVDHEDMHDIRLSDGPDAFPANKS